MSKTQEHRSPNKRDYIPVTVPFAATPTGEIPGIAQWAHHVVWTARMLSTLLGNKVRGGKWHTLIDKVFDTLNLFCSAHKVQGKKGAAGIDRQTVEHFAELLEIVQQSISDRRLLGLIKQFLDQGMFEDLRTWTPETGVPQGAVLSPVLANAYLNPLDHRMSENGYQMVRYADDFVILCRTQAEAEAALADVRTWVEQHGLTLHPEKTHIVDSRVTSFSFLGYSFRGKLRFPRKQSHEKRVDRIREQTPRKSGDSLETIIQRINQSAQGWFNFYRHCHWSIFRKYDEMVRRRLRRILLKRHRRNPKHLPRHHRWTNAYFTECGLLSLNAAHMRFVQSIGTY